jgi:signal transduction histidine kinase
LSQEHRQFLATIKDTCRLLLRMVGDLLDVTAIESGILRLERASCDLPALVAHNVELNRVLAGPKRIDVGFDPPKDFPEVCLDPEKIGQVLNNLIGNAVKFSHPGTSVRVTLGQEDGSARIAVEDQGQGIPAADLNKLFTPFGKASVRGTAGEKSTGLGLAIVRRIVEGHGGKIRVTSTVDKGSQFVFYIPIKRPCG